MMYFELYAKFYMRGNCYGEFYYSAQNSTFAGLVFYKAVQRTVLCPIRCMRGDGCA